MSTQVGFRSDRAEVIERAGLALVEFYAMDQGDWASFNKNFRRRYTDFFKECVLDEGGYNPFPNDTQQRMRDFGIAGDTMNLYISLWGTDEPTHYLILRLNQKGLWKLKHPRLKKLNPSKRLPGDGVLALVSLNGYGDPCLPVRWFPILGTKRRQEGESKTCVTM